MIANGELGQSIYLITPQINANRMISRARKHVDDRAPDGEMASMFDLVFAAVARVDELAGDVADVDLITDPNSKRLELVGTGAEPLHERSS